MNWLYKLERKFGRFAIHGLMMYIVTINLGVFLMGLVDRRGVILYNLVLIPQLVLQGQVWRLVTFLFVPPSTSILWIIFTLYFYYMLGSTLEREWGSFRFNIYYLIGILATIAGAFISGAGTTAVYLNLSLFLAFAYLYPEYQILLFFILPLKVKYLAWLNWAWIVFTVATQSMPLKIAAIASIVNYFVFFGKELVTRTRSNRQAYFNRRNFQDRMPKDFTIHKCAVCGKTEKEDPRMDFRYCSKCEGDYEYCMDHLYTHEHVKAKE